jgi:four helix bundle protein
MMNEEPESRREFDLAGRLIDFTIRVLNVVEALPNNRVGKHVAGQLVRCGSSSAPNYSEACAAESRRDFIHKMKVCLKELRETHTWLTIVRRKPLIEPVTKLDGVLSECNELVAIFVASLETAKRNAKDQREEL